MAPPQCRDNSLCHMDLCLFLCAPLRPLRFTLSSSAQICNAAFETPDERRRTLINPCETRIYNWQPTTNCCLLTRIYTRSTRILTRNGLGNHEPRERVKRSFADCPDFPGRPLAGTKIPSRQARQERKERRGKDGVPLAIFASLRET